VRPGHALTQEVNTMKFELQVFAVLIALGLIVKRLDWRGQFFLFLFIVAWIFYTWKKG
jgi:hypothetical protein